MSKVDMLEDIIRVGRIGVRHVAEMFVYLLAPAVVLETMGLKHSYAFVVGWWVCYLWAKAQREKEQDEYKRRWEGRD